MRRNGSSGWSLQGHTSPRDNSLRDHLGVHFNLGHFLLACSKTSRPLDRPLARTFLPDDYNRHGFAEAESKYYHEMNEDMKSLGPQYTD